MLPLIRHLNQTQKFTINTYVSTGYFSSDRLLSVALNRGDRNFNLELNKTSGLEAPHILTTNWRFSYSSYSLFLYPAIPPNASRSSENRNIQPLPCCLFGDRLISWFDMIQMDQSNQRIRWNLGDGIWARIGISIFGLERKIRFDLQQAV